MTRKKLILISATVVTVGSLLSEFLPEHEGLITMFVRGITAFIGQ